MFVLVGGGFVLVSCVVKFGSKILLLDAMNTKEPPPGAPLSLAGEGCVVLVFVADVCLGEAAAFA